MANSFDRMLFLTATPFQLGHHELVHVLNRFGDVRWEEQDLGSREGFEEKMSDLGHRLDDSQRAAVALQRCWSRLRPEDCGEDVDAWWQHLQAVPRDTLTNRERAVVEAYESAKRCRDVAEAALRPWVVRHNKGTYWSGSSDQASGTCRRRCHRERRCRRRPTRFRRSSCCRSSWRLVASSELARICSVKRSALLTRRSD